jgi:hypothetical protein
MKAAHAHVGGAPVQEIGIRGPKKMGEAQRLLLTESTTNSRIISHT